MAVVGIDISSRALHVCTLAEDTNEATVHVVRLDIERGDALARVRRLRDRMPARTAYRDAGVTLIAIEKPFFAGSVNGLAPLLIVYGALIACLPPDLPIMELRADDWRAECSLPKRGAKSVLKKAAIDYARVCWANPPQIIDDNTADAWCIAWAAREIDIRAGRPSVDAAA